MDYLRSFTIGTSGLVTYLNFAYFALSSDNTEDFPLQYYLFIAPIYYGLMNMVSLYFGKKFGLSLVKRLSIITAISIIIVVSFNYFISSSRINPYKSFTPRLWLYYITRLMMKHIINFNITIYNFEKYFSKSFYVKTFVIGSSIFSYFFNYVQVIRLYNAGITKYSYKDVLTVEGIGHGLNLLIFLFLLHKVLKINLYKSMMIMAIIIPIIWWVLFSGYYNTDNSMKIIQTLRMMLYSILRNNVLYYLFTILK